MCLAGGRDGTNNPLSSVEVLNTEDSQWSTVSSLPFPVNQPSLAIYRNCIRLSNRYGVSEKKSIVRTTIAELTLSDLTVKWERISSLPVSYSSLVTVIDHLLAVGGQDSEGLLTKNVIVWQLTVHCQLLDIDVLRLVSMATHWRLLEISKMTAIGA